MMLGALTPAETDRLYWRIIRAMAAVSDEIDALELAPARVRDTLYGPACLEHYRQLAAELADLADNDIPITTSSWISLLDGTPEEGTPRWHDSDVTAPTPRLRKWRRLAATLHANCPGQSRAARRRSSHRKSWPRFWTR